MMHHGIGLHGGYAAFVIFAILAVGALVAVAALLFSREGRPHDRGATDEGAPGNTAPLEAQLLALLSQKGGPVFQGEICRQLGAQSREIARILHRLEEEQLIERYWQPDHTDYAVLPAGQ